MVREQLGFSNQTEFARALRITQGTVSDWETEKTHPRHALWAVAHLCDVPDKVYHWLETGRDNPGIRKRRAG